MTTITDLEERLAWQENIIDSLNDTVTALNAEMTKQRQLLQLLYSEIQQLQGTEAKKLSSLVEEIPPHY